MNNPDKLGNTGLTSQDNGETTLPDWSVVLARFRSTESVERLVWKKMHELAPEELSLFMRAAEQRIDELSQLREGYTDLL